MFVLHDRHKKRLKEKGSAAHSRIDKISFQVTAATSSAPDLNNAKKRRHGLELKVGRVAREHLDDEASHGPDVARCGHLGHLNDLRVRVRCMHERGTDNPSGREVSLQPQGERSRVAMESNVNAPAERARPLAPSSRASPQHAAAVHPDAPLALRALQRLRNQLI